MSELDCCEKADYSLTFPRISSSSSSSSSIFSFSSAFLSFSSFLRRRVVGLRRKSESLELICEEVCWKSICILTTYS